MISSLKTYILSKLPDIPKIKGGSMKLIVILISIIVLAIMLYLFAWLHSWYKTGDPMLQELRQFVETLVSPQAVAAIAFYSAAVIDKDGDGESDMAVTKSAGDNNETNQRRSH